MNQVLGVIMFSLHQSACNSSVGVQICLNCMDDKVGHISHTKKAAHQPLTRTKMEVT